LGLKFPGGGIDPGQSVNDAAIREALEEVGYSLADKPRAIPGVRARKIDWDPVFSAEASAKGRNYRGSKHYHRMAQAGERDESLYGSEGDALKANWMPIAEVLEATRSAAANPDNKYNYFDEERLNAAEKVYEMLNQKTASDNEALEEVKKKLRVAILSGSTGDDPEELSRSRALAETYRDYLTSHGAEVDWMDMRDMGDMPDTYDWDTEWYDDYQKRLTNADAMVVSTPIFQYGPSGKVLQFLHRTLDKENQQFKPYSLLSGAGSPRSALALGGLANQLDTEIKGIGIGGGVQVAGDEFNVETGEMDPGIVSRANENAAKLLQVAGALRQSKTAADSTFSSGELGPKLTLTKKPTEKSMDTPLKDDEGWSGNSEKLRVAILSGSTKENARSRTLAETYRKQIESKGGAVDWIDMRELGDLPDVITGDKTKIQPYLDQFAKADAFVVATPVHNWGPSAKVNHFLDLVLMQHRKDMTHKPYALLSGAGSAKSHLALGPLNNQIATEIKGIGIGGGIQIAGGQFNKVTGELDEDVVAKSDENSAKLLQVARSLSDKTASHNSILYKAYRIGQKLAQADFGDDGSSDDMTLSFDNEVYQKTDPKDFVSPEPHGNMTPSTNRRGWIGATDEVNPDKTEATNYKRDYLERT
jgi:NAD(P)H-dependent FMN reductase/8-oxo-dGTP pyrophosphatase MutT (NUDIX family)